MILFINVLLFVFGVVWCDVDQDYASWTFSMANGFLAFKVSMFYHLVYNLFFRAYGLLRRHHLLLQSVWKLVQLI